MNIGIFPLAAGMNPGGGGMTLISHHKLESAAPSVSFESITGTYLSLLLMYVARGSSAPNYAELQMRFNGDTGSNYLSQFFFFQSSSHSGGMLNTSYILAAYIAAGSVASGVPGSGTITIPFYAGTTFHKDVQTFATYHDNGLDTQPMLSIIHGGRWKSSAAITSIQLAPHTGNFMAGSEFALFGV